MTESVPERIESQLHSALRVTNVLTASEAMFYPQLRYLEIATRLDATARAHGVTLTGVGINPGFVFDSLPLLLARVSSEIRRVEARRIVDVTGTGPHDIDHVGFGLEPEEFSHSIATGRIHGHIGLPESVAVVAERLGMVLERIEESWQTHTGPEPIITTIGTIDPGRVIGITQVARGFDEAEERVRMELLMFYEPMKFGLVEEDLVTITGRHTVRAAIRPSCVSILGAALMITNAVADIVQAPAGLRTVVDLPIATRPRGRFTFASDPTRPPRPGLTYLRRVPCGERDGSP
jgi:4-hydroxy-tetrahydrodipicolinate reductase